MSNLKAKWPNSFVLTTSFAFRRRHRFAARNMLSYPYYVKTDASWAGGLGERSTHASLSFGKSLYDRLPSRVFLFRPLS